MVTTNARFVLVFVALVALSACSSVGRRGTANAAPAEGIQVNANCSSVVDATKWCALDPSSGWKVAEVTVLVRELTLTDPNTVPSECMTLPSDTWCVWVDGEAAVAQRPVKKSVLKTKAVSVETEEVLTEDTRAVLEEPKPMKKPEATTTEIETRLDDQAEAIRATNGQIRILMDAVSKKGSNGKMVVKSGKTIQPVPLSSSCSGSRKIPVYNMDKVGEVVAIYVTDSVYYVADGTINPAMSGHGTRSNICLPANMSGELVGCIFEDGFKNATATSASYFGGKLKTEDPSVGPAQLYRTKQDPKNLCSFLERE